MQAIKGRNGIPKVIASTNARNDVWVVGGDDYMSYWILDTKENRLRTERANLRMVKRDILSIVVSIKWISSLTMHRKCNSLRICHK